MWFYEVDLPSLRFFPDLQKVHLELTLPCAYFAGATAFYICLGTYTYHCMPPKIVRIVHLDSLYIYIYI